MKKEKFKNVIIIPPCHTYGDILSIIGMVYFLLDYYEHVYLNIQNHYDGMSYVYFENFFKNDNKFNKKIFLISDISEKLKSEDYSDLHFINLHTGEWNCASFQFVDHPNVNSEFYFNCSNPLYNKIDYDENYKLEPNKQLPPEGLNINHLFYYELIGLNNNVRMDFFNYERNLQEEELVKKTILNNHGVGEFEKYNLINNPDGFGDEILSIIDNGYKTINIHNITDFPGKLLRLLEDSESLHLVEGSNVNFFYHCQYKNIFKYDKKILFHVWCRNRNWPQYKLDFAYRMMETPKLKNWVFYHDKKDLNN